MASDVNKPGNSEATLRKFIRNQTARILCWCLIGFLPAMSSGLAAPTVARPERARPQFVPGQIIVKTRTATLPASLERLARKTAAVRPRELRHLNARLINMAEEEVEAVLAALRADPDVEYAERDYLAEGVGGANDPYVLSGQTWHLARIGALAAWETTTGQSDVLVAVLDSGVQAEHPDLGGRIVSGYDFISGDADPADDFGHGTAVAGAVVAAVNNGIGVAGVAPGCRVLAVKVMNASGFAPYSAVAQGIRFAVEQGARVINLSLAGNMPSQALQEAVDHAWSNHVVVVAAAGNNATTTPMYPAACERVVAVSATSTADARAGFSSFGTFVKLAAPGEDIWTTQTSATYPYGPWRGTSLASPLVAAAAALMLSVNPMLSAERVATLLQATADDLGPTGWDAEFGFGRVNAHRAVMAALAEPGAWIIPPPPVTLPPDEPAAPADQTPPQLAITFPSENPITITAPVVLFRGTAEDGSGVDRIEVRVNGGPVQIARGQTDWTAEVTLTPGTNRVLVRAVDLAGNASVEEARAVIYPTTATVTVQIQGSGRVTPDVNGALLRVGKTYTLRAVPLPGYIFAGWDGVSCAAPQLQFVLRSSMCLVAKFIPSPFQKGTYAGLWAETNGVMPHSAGYFRLTLNPSGTFSGSVRLAGKDHGFRGQFDFRGNATVVVTRALQSPLYLTLSVDLVQAGEPITGRVSDGTWVAELYAGRNVFDPLTNPAPLAGTRAVEFSYRQEEATAQVASGVSQISVSGNARLSGRLADKRALSALSTLNRQGEFPFYQAFNRGSEIMLGWLDFARGGGAPEVGEVFWVRTGTNGFATTLRASATALNAGPPIVGR